MCLRSSFTAVDSKTTFRLVSYESWMQVEVSRRKWTILDAHEVWETMLADPGRTETLSWS